MWRRNNEQRNRLGRAISAHRASYASVADVVESLGLILWLIYLETSTLKIFEYCVVKHLGKGAIEEKGVES